MLILYIDIINISNVGQIIAQAQWFMGGLLPICLYPSWQKQVQVTKAKRVGFFQALFFWECDNDKE